MSAETSESQLSGCGSASGLLQLVPASPVPTCSPKRAESGMTGRPATAGFDDLAEMVGTTLAGRPLCGGGLALHLRANRPKNAGHIDATEAEQQPQDHDETSRRSGLSYRCSRRRQYGKD